MKLKKIVILSLLGLNFGFFFIGCTEADPEDTPIPWSRPAEWEGKVPGLGGPGG